MEGGDRGTEQQASGGPCARGSVAIRISRDAFRLTVGTSVSSTASPENAEDVFTLKTSIQRALLWECGSSRLTSCESL